LPGFDNGGAREKILSVDHETGALTLMLHLPAGWRRDATGYQRAPEEVFVLRGDLVVGTECLTDGCYTYVPPEMVHGPLGTRGGCFALVMLDGRPDFVTTIGSRPISEPDQYIPCLNTVTMPWGVPRPENPPVGIVIKTLRIDPETKDQTWIAASVPFRRGDRAEVHPTVEEAFMLRGEILLGERGIMREGCYFWRPPNVPHGPLVSKTGSMYFFRTKGGSLETRYITPPDWERTVHEYYSSGPLFPLELGS
jgi:hypothetical protein